MSTTITLAFEAYLAAQTVSQQPVVLDEFIFANVPGLDPDAPVDPAEGIPQMHIVWRQAVDKAGVVNSDTVVYSVLLGTGVGDFTFNWVGLINKSSGMLAMVTHIPPQDKYANVDGNQGNALTRSFVMEYSGAQAATLINVPAETWQIDFTARLGAMDEHDRVTNVDLYGPGAFFGDGFLVRESAGAYSIQSGAGYVGGLRVSLSAAAPVNAATRPTKVWVDASWTGTAASVWNTQQTITVAPTLANYVQDGVSHYVFAVAQINADGSVTDLRPKGTVDGGQQASEWLRKKNNLSDVSDPGEGRKNLGCGTAATKDWGYTSGKLLPHGAYGIGNYTPLPGPPTEGGNTLERMASYTGFYAHKGGYNTQGYGYGMPSELADGEDYAVIAVKASQMPNMVFGLVWADDGLWFDTLDQGMAGRKKWARVFSDRHPPSAADTNAVSKTGDTMTDKLTMNVDGEAIRLKPKTAGAASYIISQDSAGANNWYVGAGSNNNNDVQLVNYKAANSMIQLKADGAVNINPAQGKNAAVNGPLQVGAVGSAILNIGDGDSGLRSSVDGAVDLWANNQKRGYWNTTTFSFTGQIIPSDYGNFDARYYTQSAANAKFVQGVQWSAEYTKPYGGGAAVKANAGGAISGLQEDQGDNEIHTYYFKTLQEFVNGAWKNVAG